MFLITKSIIPIKQFHSLYCHWNMMILVFLESYIGIYYSLFVIKGGTNKEKDLALVEKYLSK